MSIAKSILQVSAIALFVGALCSNTAHAADGSFPVTSNVVQSCVVTIPAAMDFGVYDAFGVNETADRLAEANINVQCSAGTPAATMYMSKGTITVPADQSCDSSKRYMYNGANPLAYSLHQDSSRVGYWGCKLGTASLGGKAIGPFTNSLTPITTTVYGKIAKNQQLAPVGTYTDTVNVWISF